MRAHRQSIWKALYVRCSRARMSDIMTIVFGNETPLWQESIAALILLRQWKLDSSPFYLLPLKYFKCCVLWFVLPIVFWLTLKLLSPGLRLNIKIAFPSVGIPMFTIRRSSYRLNWNSYTCKTISLYWEITYPFPIFNGCTDGVWEWISNFIPHFIMDVIIYLYWD